jgi:predicted TPR repeat methyltransferase
MKIAGPRAVAGWAMGFDRVGHRLERSGKGLAAANRLRRWLSSHVIDPEQASMTAPSRPRLHIANPAKRVTGKRPIPKDRPPGAQGSA